MPFSTELSERCYKLLIRFDDFDSHQSLKSIFTKAAELKEYAYDLPEAYNRRDRVNRVMAFLIDKHSLNGSVFVLFLNELFSQVPKDDDRYRQLQELVPLVAVALSNKDHPDYESHMMIAENDLRRSIDSTASAALNESEPQKLSSTNLETNGPARVRLFLSYGRPDYAQVESIYMKLKEAGFDPWLDKKSIFGGEAYDLAITNAIKSADFFLFFLSSHSANRRGFLQREVKLAIDQWQERRLDDIYLIPLRLEACESPDELSRFQWIDMFEDDGWLRLTDAIQEGHRRLRRT